MTPSELVLVLRGYAVDFDTCGPQYAQMAAVQRQAADTIEAWYLSTDGPEKVVYAPGHLLTLSD